MKVDVIYGLIITHDHDRYHAIPLIKQTVAINWSVYLPETENRCNMNIYYLLQS